MATNEQERERRRPERQNYYVVDPDTKTIQMTFGKPKPKPKAIIYLPHYEKSLRIEVDLPDGDPEEVQTKLEEYKEKFINWFGGDKKKGYNWGNKTRRWVWNNVSLKVQGVKLPRQENRALRTLFMYKNILNKFEQGKQRKDIVSEISKQRDFQFEQKRKQNKRIVFTGVLMKTQRKESTINRDISSLVKTGILKKLGKGKYEVDTEKSLNLEVVGDGLLVHRKKKI